MNAEFVIKVIFIALVVSNIIQWYAILHLSRLTHLNRAGMDKISDILTPMIDLIEKLIKKDVERTLKDIVEEGKDDGR